MITYRTENMLMLKNIPHDAVLSCEMACVVKKLETLRQEISR